MSKAMRYCPNCGEELRIDAKFCPYCGVSLEGSSPAGSSQPAERSSLTLGKRLVIAVAVCSVVIALVLALASLTGPSPSSSGSIVSPQWQLIRTVELGDNTFERTYTATSTREPTEYDFELLANQFIYELELRHPQWEILSYDVDYGYGAKSVTVRSRIHGITP